MKEKSKWALTVAFILLNGVALYGQSSEEKKAVSVEEACKMIAKDSTFLVLDVRTPEEYTGELGHIDHSILIPVQELEKRIYELDKFKGTTILAVCRTGRRSKAVTEILTKSGFKALDVEGGMVKWNEKKLPLAKEEN